MPFYQFTVPSGGATLQHKAEIAEAVTKVHAEVTGAPSAYVHCAFTEVEAEFALWDLHVREGKISEAVPIARGLAGQFPDNQELGKFLAAHDTTAKP